MPFLGDNRLRFARNCDINGVLLQISGLRCLHSYIATSGIHNGILAFSGRPQKPFFCIISFVPVEVCHGTGIPIFMFYPSPTGAVYATWSNVTIDGKTNFTHNKAGDDGGELEHRCGPTGRRL